MFSFAAGCGGLFGWLSAQVMAQFVELRSGVQPSVQWDVGEIFTLLFYCLVGFLGALVPAWIG